MPRKKRNAKKRIKLLVEGSTEKNYFEGLKKNPDIVFNIKNVVDMHGGGYSNFLKVLKKESSVGYLATFIFIDLDTASSDKKNINELTDYCIRKNKESGEAYFLIGTNKNFEFFVCLHCLNYKNQDTTQFIKNNLQYQSIQEYKGDKKIFEVLNKNQRSYKNAIGRLSGCSSYFIHKFKVKKKGIDIIIKFDKRSIVLDEEQLNCNNSNINEFFDFIFNKELS